MTTPLAAEIRALIAAEGPMPVSRYMALCLSHPRLGYYMTRDPFGTAGDFITAPEISQMFGELVGLWAVAAWQQMGAPAVLRLIELGPGRGTLMADALRAARLVPAFLDAARVHLVETSPVLRAKQEATLAAATVPLAWHARLEDVPAGPCVILANEFFDALPIDQYVKQPDGWHERRVGLNAAGDLAFGLDPLPSRLAQTLAAHHPPAQDGAMLERMEPAAARAMGARLASAPGYGLAIDYGHTAEGFGDTLQAMERQTFVDPLARPGEADLTAHVDFSALARHLRQEGARAFGPLPQGEFLLRLGLAQRAERLKAQADVQTRAAVDAAAARLAGTGEGQMGALFKVLAAASPALPPPPGFDSAEEFAS